MTTVSPVTQIEELNKRLERAREIVGEGHVSPVVGKEGQYVVQACKGGYYLVNGECTCRDPSTAQRSTRAGASTCWQWSSTRRLSPRNSPASRRMPGPWKSS